MFNDVKILKKILLKAAVLLSAILLLSIFFSWPVKAVNVQGMLDGQKRASGASDLPSKVPEGAKSGLSSMGINSTDVKDISRFTPANLLKAASAAFKKAIGAPIASAAAVVGILIACALLKTLGDTMGHGMESVFGVVTVLCVSTLILFPVAKCVSDCAGTIKESSAFMTSFMPVYVSLAAASGRPASAAAGGSMVLAACGVLSQLAATVFVPMVDIFLTFCVVGSVSPGIRIRGIAKFIKSAVSWALGLCLTVFTGILAVQNTVSAAADGLATKTAKFVVEGAVPIIGSSVSDAVNTVLGCASLLKTTVGAYAIVVLILVFLAPVLECILWLLAVELSLAAAEILGIENMSGLLNSLKEALELLIALVVTSALAMIISISVLLLTGMGK